MNKWTKFLDFLCSFTFAYVTFKNSKWKKRILSKTARTAFYTISFFWYNLKSSLSGNWMNRNKMCQEQNIHDRHRLSTMCWKLFLSYIYMYFFRTNTIFAAIQKVNFGSNTWYVHYLLCEDTKSDVCSLKCVCLYLNVLMGNLISGMSEMEWQNQMQTISKYRNIADGTCAVCQHSPIQ